MLSAVTRLRLIGLFSKCTADSALKTQLISTQQFNNIVSYNGTLSSCMQAITIQL